MARPHLIVITGPTASGKSSLAIRVARWLGETRQQKKFSITGAEIISADSRQVYQYLDIGTGKISDKEKEGIPHYCLNIAHPKKTFSADDYRRYAENAIGEIYQKNKIPIVVGGTGFYIDALLYGASYPEVPPDWELRKKLEKESTEELFRELEALDPTRASTIDMHNKRRLIRALEIIKHAGWIPVSNKHLRFDSLILGLQKPPDTLKKNIIKRLHEWLEAGFVREVSELHTLHGVSWERLSEIGLNYRLAAEHLRGTLSYDEMVKKTETEIWHYAKRQLTYLKRMPGIHWIKTFTEAKNATTKFLLAD